MKSVEAQLKEVTEQKIALEAELVKQAGSATPSDTYTERMQKMESAIEQANERMKEMEAKMDNYAKMKAELDKKMEDTKASLADIYVDKSEDEDEEEEGEGEGMAENQIGGVNEKVIAGQKKGKKAKKAKKVEEDSTEEADMIEKKTEGKAKAEETPAVQATAEEVAPTPVAEVVAPVAVAEEVKAVAPATEIAVMEATISKLAQVTEKVASTESKFTQLDAELNKAKETMALEAKIKSEAFATVTALQAKYEALLAKVTNIESNNQTVEEKVAKTVASLGVEPVSISADANNIPKTGAELLQEWASITEPRAKRAFYLQHADAIHGASGLTIKKK
jgi:CII-binding regulator of phage lambda lysogenization HflD